ncbi:ATP-dependent DNA helicase PIF1 [Holothuria leucospilota]|uniref:ATP-dependent DNA helicase n=1 Tax=Holothuria leucospilota TaxID=206669 RepID=A0A9Q1BXA4_HOLLE|nr:ATP-dependent DNA helicase PIF1 [Holothuria leucospilota]
MEEILLAAQRGHSFFLFGQAGKGRTYTLLKVIDAIKKHRKVLVSASTGIAATSLCGKTVHSLFGLRDGRFTSVDLIHKIDNDANFYQIKGNITQTDVLIIDEISMLSRVTFLQLEEVIRTVRGGLEQFGGMQIIAAGDLYQLKPVPNPVNSDPGELIIVDDFIKKAIPHHFILQEVYRQTEDDLVAAIHQLSKGIECLQETVKLMNELQRPLPQNSRPIRLFATNYDVDRCNSDNLLSMKGENVANRKQIPVKLAFAMTVHKAQGMTLDQVEVHCQNMTIPGQIGVVIGRATTKSGLRVLNFNPSQVVRQSQLIDDFYNSSSAPLQDGCCCCTRSHIKPDSGQPASGMHRANHTQQILQVDKAMENDETSIEFLDFFEEAIVLAQDLTLPENVNPDHYLSDIYFKNTYTDEQKLVNNMIPFLKARAVITGTFFKLIYHQVVVLFNECISNENPSGSSFTEFYSKVARLKSSPGGYRTIRYIGGWCLGSLRYNKQKTVISNLYNDTNKVVVENSHNDVLMLDSLMCTEAEARETAEDPLTLSQIERKDSLKGSLCHIHEKTFAFFKILDKFIRKHETIEHLAIHGKDLYDVILKKIMEDESLTNMWEALFEIKDDASLQKRRAFNLLGDVKKYFRMSAGQFRKEYVRMLWLKLTESK